ncbi:MAG: hypothetical protein ABI237_13120 [Ginsengibacter sp.]
MKLTTSLLFCFALFILYAVEGNAQSSFSFSTGFSTDMNNHHNAFHHIPVSIQWKPSPEKRAPFFIEFNYDIPFAHKGTDNAYTLDASLPEEVTLQKNIRASIFTASIGFRIHLNTDKKNNSLYLNLIPFGLCSQSFKVTYKNYDKVNYEVLNPDVNVNNAGAVVSMAIVYNFHKQRQDMLLMLHAQSPLLKKRNEYPASFRFVAPLQFTFGYNFYYNKKK